MTDNLGGGSIVPARAAYLGAALLTIGLGLAVHLRGGALPSAVRDGTGDARWAAMVYWRISAIWPRASMAARAGGAIAFAFGIKFSQCYHAPGIDAVRATMLGHLVLGSAFDPRDLVSYVSGVGVAVVVTALLRDRPVHPRALPPPR